MNLLLSIINGNSTEKVKCGRKGFDEKDKPNMLLEHNKNMGEEDKYDKFLNYYVNSRNAYPWSKRVFFKLSELFYRLNGFVFLLKC